jgi:hypothetical protein
MTGPGSGAAAKAGAVADARAKLFHLLADPVHRLVARLLSGVGRPRLRCGLRGDLGWLPGYRSRVTGVVLSRMGLSRIGRSGVSRSGVSLSGISRGSPLMGRSRLLRSRLMKGIRLVRLMLRNLRLLRGTGVVRMDRMRLGFRAPGLMTGNRMLWHGCRLCGRIVRGGISRMVGLRGIGLPGVESRGLFICGLE